MMTAEITGFGGSSDDRGRSRAGLRGNGDSCLQSDLGIWGIGAVMLIDLQIDIQGR